MENAYNAEIPFKIKEIVEPILSNNGLELYDVEYRREQIGWVLRIFIDKAGGVKLSDCELVSRPIGNAIEASGILNTRYFLEVSSPGLDRPLITEKDFLRNNGKEVKLSFSESNVRKELLGKIAGFSNGKLELETIEGRKEIDLSSILKAKIVIKF
jgi:ribosome maturation factor RimP